MEGQDFLTEYRNISNKLKKRFLRRPNVAEASDHFRLVFLFMLVSFTGTI
jgi:hypothetical protein